MSDNMFSEIDPEVIARLADIVAEKDLGEISVSCCDCSVTVKGRRCPPPPMPMPMNMPMGMPAAVPVPPRSGEVSISEVKETESAETISGSPVKSPIVGTYYSAPSPDKPPFVKVGQHVKKGDVLMIIESMKLMNEIQSDYDGTVAEILVTNGQAVEYDQTIMIIKEDQ